MGFRVGYKRPSSGSLQRLFDLKREEGAIKPELRRLTESLRGLHYLSRSTENEVDSLDKQITSIP